MKLIWISTLPIAFCALVGFSCRRQSVPPVLPVREVHQPESSSAWTGHPGNLGEWGQTPGLIYGTLYHPETKKRQLVYWQWKDGRLLEAPIFDLPQALDVKPISDGICGYSYNKSRQPEGAWPYAFVKMSDNSIIFEWPPSCGWYIFRAGVNRHGKYILLVRESPLSPDNYRGKERTTRIVLLDQENKTHRVITELTGDGVGTTRTIALSDDERFVALGGWDNGVAMIDCREGKVLWSKRPKEEISTTKVVFRPDSKILYSTGSAGCVYEIDVLTGNILNRRWASPTGDAVAGHRASAMDFSQDGKWLAVGTGPEGDTYCWNLESGSAPIVFHHKCGTIDIVSISPDSKKIATVGGGCLKVWVLESEASSLLPTTMSNN